MPFRNLYGIRLHHQETIQIVVTRQQKITSIVHSTSLQLSEAEIAQEDIFDVPELESACQSTLRIHKPHVSYTGLVLTRLTLSSSLKLSIVAPNGDTIDGLEDTGSNLIAGLTAMPNLEALSICLNNNESLTSKIRTAFRTSKTTLATIKVLEAEYVPNAAFLLRACPSLETFSTVFPNKQWKKTFEALASMPDIRQVHVINRKGWKPTHFEGEKGGYTRWSRVNDTQTSSNMCKMLRDYG